MDPPPRVVASADHSTSTNLSGSIDFSTLPNMNMGHQMLLKRSHTSKDQYGRDELLITCESEGPLCREILSLRSNVLFVIFGKNEMIANRKAVCGCADLAKTDHAVNLLKYNQSAWNHAQQSHSVQVNNLELAVQRLPEWNFESHLSAKAFRFRGFFRVNFPNQPYTVESFVISGPFAPTAKQAVQGLGVDIVNKLDISNRSPGFSMYTGVHWLFYPLRAAIHGSSVSQHLMPYLRHKRYDFESSDLEMLRSINFDTMRTFARMIVTDLCPRT